MLLWLGGFARPSSANAISRCVVGQRPQPRSNGGISGSPGNAAEVHGQVGSRVGHDEDQTRTAPKRHRAASVVVPRSRKGASVDQVWRSFARKQIRGSPASVSRGRAAVVSYPQMNWGSPTIVSLTAWMFAELSKLAASVSSA
jgi:hypothetical protein